MESLIYGIGFVFVYVVLAIIAAVVFYFVARFFTFTITVSAAVNLISSLRIIIPIDKMSYKMIMFWIINICAVFIAFIVDCIAWSDRRESIFDKGEL